MSEMAERCLDSDLWHVNAGIMVRMPPLNSKVFYFPQGHAEHTLTNVEFGAFRIPAMILCRVASLKYLADSETDEVYVKIGLIPIGDNDHGFDDGEDSGNNRSNSGEKLSFPKVLTQSDANNGGGFSVPRSCAEAIFPPLDYRADPPVQNLYAKDVHGETWKFRHIYRGTPKRHLLTTGWSTFVNKKKLVAGDSIVFTRAENRDICVGIRRAKKDHGISVKQSSSLFNVGGFSSFSEGVSRVKPESVVEAAILAVSGKAFEVEFYPLSGMPEFFVSASSVKAARKTQWRPHLRFKMTFESEGSSQISSRIGTIASVQDVDPVHWPNSLWRSLQVTWDEPDLLPHIKCVNPWLVELLSNIPTLNLSPLPPSCKKLRLPVHQDFPLDTLFPMPSFSGNHFGMIRPSLCFSDNKYARIQGARHANIGDPFMDLQLSNKLHIGLQTTTNPGADPHTKEFYKSKEKVSCSLSIANNHQKSEKICGVKTRSFVLFGQTILTEQQMTHDPSLGQISSDEKPCTTENCSPSLQDIPKSPPSTHFFCNQDNRAAESDHFEVFLDAEDVQSLDLSVLQSYEELYAKLEDLFGIEKLEMVSHLFYYDANDNLKEARQEPFSEFIKSAKSLKFLWHTNQCNC